jgi:integrase
MFNWAVAREYLDHTPFKRGNQNRIPMELEDNHRHRRLGEQEEKALLAAATGPLRTLMIAALDTGMRRGEMLALTWGNVDARPGWLRLRGETTKSSRTRWVPVSTARLKAVLDFLRADASGQAKPGDAAVFSNQFGEPLRYFERGWRSARTRANITDLNRDAG